MSDFEDDWVVIEVNCNSIESIVEDDCEVFLISLDVVSIDDVVNWEWVIEIEDSWEVFGLCWVYNFIF